MPHPDPSSLNAFLNGTLPPAEMLALSDHLSECEPCRAEMERVTLGAKPPPAVAWFPAQDAMLHLSEEEIALAAADDSALPSEMLAHLQSCFACREEIADAKRFSSPALALVPRRVAPSRTRWLGWAGLAAAAALLFAFFLARQRHAVDTSTADGDVMVAELQDGGSRLALDARGELHGAPASSAAYTALMAGALQTHRLPLTATPQPQMQETRGDASTLPAYRVESPLNEQTLPSPEFRWQALAGAQSYEVEVRNDALHLIARSPRLGETNWTPPKPLPADVAYTWVVKAQGRDGVVQTPAPPMPEARFRVASMADLAAIAEARTSDPGSHLLLAAMYAKLGMPILARAEVDALGRENPGSPLVRQLAESLAASAQSSPSSTKPAQ